MVNYGESGIEQENLQVAVLLCNNRNTKKVLSKRRISLFFFLLLWLIILCRGGRVVRWCLVNFQCWGVLQFVFQ